MIAFIDDRREAYGVEPICCVLPIAPSTCRDREAKRRDPSRLPARARRDAVLKLEVRRVFEENFRVYGVRKVWRHLKREGFDVAPCTVSRLMRQMGFEGAIRGKPVRTTVSDKAAPCPLEKVNRRRGPWRSFKAVEFAILEWVDWFDNRRLLEPIGNIPPAEAEARYCAMLEQPAMAARLKRTGLRGTRGGS